MGTVAQAVEVFRIYANEPAPRSRQIARHLIDDGLLPKSSGKRIEHLSAVDVATYLLAISTAKKAADAARCATTWGSMTLHSERRRPATGGPPLDRLLDFIAKMVDDVWSENGDVNGPGTKMVLDSTLEITTTCPHAIVDLEDQRYRFHYLPPGGDPPSGRQRVDRIPGDTLRQIAMALHEGPPRDPASVLTAPLDR
jgi:hypothetical protein